MPTQSAPPGSFEAEFYSRLNGIIDRGRAIGLSVSSICEQADIARATPTRWRARLPLTIALIDKMEDVVRKEEERKRAADEQHPAA